MNPITFDPAAFSEALYRVLPEINPGLRALELYELRYCLNNITPLAGWQVITCDPPEAVEQMVNTRAFYDRIQIKPRVGERIILDEPVVRLTQMLLVGLVTGAYTPQWVNTHFYFDIRGFYFLHRTRYFNDEIRAHLGGAPYRQFEKRQQRFTLQQDVGYQEFKAANAEIDAAFIEVVQRLIALRGAPLLMAIAGPTAAGKTEIVERLQDVFAGEGKRVTTMELDNFLTDRDYREAKGIFTQGKQALHFELLQQSLRDITAGKTAVIPRYDFVFATSSHDLDGNLKPGGVPIQIEPADILFIEGNFPFLLPEIAPLIGLKVVYLTDDPVRMQRKWKRDIDYRKKYEPTYFRNRYFKDQFIMAEIAYRPQMALCDICVDTTGAALWLTPQVAAVLKPPH